MTDYFKNFFKAIITFNIVVLISVFTIAYYFDMSACKLCHYQQILFVAATLFAIIGIFANSLHKPFAVIITLLYLLNSSVSGYQVLMEEKLIDAQTACIGQIPTDAANFEDFKNRILTNDQVPCEIPKMRFFGITLAGYSLIASTAMFLFTFLFTIVLVFFRYNHEESSH